MSGIQFKKGTSFAEEGDFSAAGAIHMNYLDVLDRPIVKAEAGGYGFRRVLLAASPRVGEGTLLGAFELGTNDGPWTRPDDFRKLNGVLRYSRGTALSGFSLTGLFYDGAVELDRPGPAARDRRGPHLALRQHRPDGRRPLAPALARRRVAARRRALRDPRRGLRVALRASTSSRTSRYFLDDPEHGDQFEQRDERWVSGLGASRLLVSGAPPCRRRSRSARRSATTTSRRWASTTRPAATRLDTVREDDVRQASAALYAQADTRWSDKVRTVLGLRGDAYRFDVDSSDPLNSGKRDASRASPKLTLALGPWSRTELYASYGWGFHSNDARGATITRDPSTGEPAERGRPARARAGRRVRACARSPCPGLHATASFWGLDLDSELLFVGDAGTTEASRPSRRRGVELTAEYEPRPWLRLDASYADSSARFTDDDPVGDHIPGAIEGVFARRRRPARPRTLVGEPARAVVRAEAARRGRHGPLRRPRRS